MARRKPKKSKLPAKPLQRDRAFRALANESPEIIPRLLVALGIAPPGEAPPVIESMPTGLDPPAARIEADLVVRYEAGIRHVEWQGWPDAGFRARSFGYHLSLTLKYAPTPVRTVVIWSRVPSQEEIAPYETGQMTVTFDHIILAHQDPERLLADPVTACFAMACRTDDPAALAVRVVAALQGAPPRAAVVAALAARALSPYIYEVFRKEWEARGMEPIIIEELARMLEDQGAERGRREGEEMARRVILDLADAYGLALDEPRRAWIASASLEELERVRVTLKRERAWPTLSGATRRRPLVPVAAADLRVPAVRVDVSVYHLKTPSVPARDALRECLSDEGFGVHQELYDDPSLELHPCLPSIDIADYPPPSMGVLALGGRRLGDAGKARLRAATAVDEPELSRATEHSGKPLRCLGRDRSSSLDEAVDVLRGEARAVGELGLRPRTLLE